MVSVKVADQCRTVHRGLLAYWLKAIGHARGPLPDAWFEERPALAARGPASRAARGWSRATG